MVKLTAEQIEETKEHIASIIRELDDDEVIAYIFGDKPEESAKFIEEFELLQEENESAKFVEEFELLQEENESE